MDLQFKKFSDFERGTILLLLRDGYSFDKRYEKDWLTNWQESDTFFYDHIKIADACGFVSVKDNIPIGFICWDPRHLPEYIEVGHNCIASKYKGKGYGKRQLHEAIIRMKLTKAKSILVTTDEGLIPAQKNYESVGFHFQEYRENSINPEYAGRLMDYKMQC